MTKRSVHIERVQVASAAVDAARGDVSAAIAGRAQALRDAHAAGHTWAELGQILGTTPQRAQAASKQTTINEMQTIDQKEVTA